MPDIQTLRFADRFEGITGSAIREILKLLNRPGMISFGGGNPAAAALEEDVVARLAGEVLHKNGKAILQYGPTEGYAPLREALARWLPRFGFSPEPDHILPITGSTQGIDLMAKALLNPGDVVLVENPTFLGTLQALRLYQAKIVPVPTDEGGIDPDILEELVRRHQPKMLYVIPTFQNPTGRTLLAQRRPRIAQMAEQYGFVVLEDDPYRDLRYRGEPLPAIKSYDQSGWVVHLSSTSKLVSPGLRVGAVVAHPSILRKLIIGKQSSDVQTTTLSQAIVAEYLNQGLMEPHIQQICGMYRAQMDCMLDCLKAFPEGTTHTLPQGGLFTWVQLPGKLNAQKLFSICVEQGVAFVPGTSFFVDGGHEDTLRLNFSNSTLEQIQRGMGLLAQQVKQALKG